jgi:Holliday junction resolvase-like predicted endonuclease
MNAINPRNLRDVEKHLEDWIEADPSLIQEGLLILGRQIHTDVGFIDLLGVDTDGRWMVIEVKKGSVRKETVLQAAKYAASVAEMDETELRAKIDLYLATKETDLEAVLGENSLDEERIFNGRAIVVYVVGTGQEQRLNLSANAMSLEDYPINLIHFDVANGVLVRKVTPLDANESTQPRPKRRGKRAPVIKTHAIERMLKLAEQNGIGEEFHLMHDACMKHGLYPRLYRWSIMYAPPQNRTRCLVCVWAVAERAHLRVYIASHVFAEFYPVSEGEAIAYLGRDRWERFQPDQAQAFAESLAKLFSRIADNSENR